MVDGFGGGWTRERTLEIMKDSRIGSFGAIALVLMLLGKFVALIELDALLVAPALIAGHAFSRLCSTLLLHCLDYAREEGKAKPLATRITLWRTRLCTVFGCAALFLLPPARWRAASPSRSAPRPCSPRRSTSASAAIPATASAPPSRWPSSPSTPDCCAGLP